MENQKPISAGGIKTMENAINYLVLNSKCVKLCHTTLAKRTHNRKLVGSGKSHRVWWATYRPLAGVGKDPQLHEFGTCPNTCELREYRVCYAMAGYYTRIQASRAEEHTTEIDLSKCGPDVLRLNVTGDIGMYGWLSPVYLAKLIAIAKAWPLTKVYGYTHFPARVWAEAVRELAPPNFVLYESISEKPAVPATCWRTARVVEVIDDVASDEYVCPYDLAKMLGHKRIKVTCDTCMACPKGDKNIVFPLI